MRVSVAHLRLRLTGARGLEHGLVVTTGSTTVTAAAFSLTRGGALLRLTTFGLRRVSGLDSAACLRPPLSSGWSGLVRVGVRKVEVQQPPPQVPACTCPVHPIG